MKIVALRGKSGTGKTTTLKMFLLRLLKQYNITTINYETNKRFTSEDLEKEIAKENLSSLSSSAGAQDYIVKFEVDGVKYENVVQNITYQIKHQHFHHHIQKDLMMSHMHYS